MIKTKQKKQIPLGMSEDLPEGIFGYIPPQETKKKKRKNKIKKKIKHAITGPKIKVTKEAKTEELPDLDYDNVVKVAPQLVKHLSKKIDIRTKDLSLLMLSRLAPSAISFEQAASYTSAVMKDSFNVDMEIDHSVFDLVKSLMDIDIVFFYIRRMSLPTKYKRELLRIAMEKMLNDGIEQMANSRKTNKSYDRFQQLKQLSAVLSDRTKRKVDSKLLENAVEEVDNALRSSELGAVRPRRRD